MAQVKIYGRRDSINPIKSRLSDTIHACVVEALHYPPDKRFHRFFPMDAADFIFPDDRSEKYTIIEISIFEGRSIEAKKMLLKLLMTLVPKATGISPNDLEITLFETPRENWGIRGKTGDELTLNYKVDV